MRYARVHVYAMMNCILETLIVADSNQVYSDWPDANAVSGDKSTAGEHFLRQAIMDLYTEKGRICLSTVQALGIAAFESDITGKSNCLSTNPIEIAVWE